MSRSLLGAAFVAVPVFAITAPAWSAVILDPLHGYCAVGCIDNGTNSPTSQNPPTNFGFTIDPGPASGTLLIDFLTPNNQTAGPSFGVTGTLSGTATLVAGSPWISGQLDAFLGISAAPTNPIGAFLPSTQALDPGATGFNVYQASFANVTLQGANNPNVSPLENITSGVLPQASYIVGFLEETSGILATADSGAIFDTGTPVIGGVPEPGSLVLLGSALAGFGWLGWRRRQRAEPAASGVA